MDAAAFEQAYGAFGDFHACFASLFGRRETREHSGHYLQVFSVNYFCRFRRLFLPVHLLFLTALLGHSGAVAGDRIPG